MSGIFKALSQGYTASSILKMLTSSNPSLASKVKKAMIAGYTVDKIVNFLGNATSTGNSTRALSDSERIARNTQKAGNIVKGTALAAGALGVGALARGMAGVGPQVMANAPGQATPGGNIPQTTPQPPQPVGQTQPAQPLAQPSQSSLPQSPLPGNTPSQQQTPIQTPPAQQPPIDSIAILKEMGLDAKVNNLLNAGNPPETISSLIHQTLAPHQKKWLDKALKEGKAKTISEMVDDFAQNPEARRAVSKQGIEAMNEEIQPQEPSSSSIEPDSATLQEKPKLAKGRLVASPSGIGELESIRNKEALVKGESGKLHKVKVDDLIESPLPEKDLATLHDELIKGIEEETGEDVSRMVNWAGYNPQTNKLSFLPHIGALYIYGNISPEDREFLTSTLNVRKTSGKNWIGAWKEGSKSPIGAAMSALIKRLQAERGGKGNEYEEKFDTIYDATEVAKQASKTKKSEEEKRKRKENKR